MKGSTVHFNDGTQEDDVDIIVAATGYDYTYVACIPLLFAWLRRLWTTVVLYGDDGAYIYRDKMLNKCLKRAARIILQCAFLTPSVDMFSKLNWFSFSEIVKYRKATLVFKCVNRMTPMYMTNIFTPHTQTRQSTRMALTIHFANKELLRYEFCCESGNHMERLAYTMTSFKCELRITLCLHYLA